MKGAPRWPSPRSQAKEEAEPVEGGQDRVRRLQGHRAAAQVHLRPRQDPRSPGDRASAPRSSGRSPRRSRTPARWRCCPTPAPRAERGDQDDEAHPDPGGLRPRRPRRRRRRQGRVRPQLPDAALASPSPWTKGGEKQVASIQKARSSREIDGVEEARRSGTLESQGSAAHPRRRVRPPVRRRDRRPTSCVRSNPPVARTSTSVASSSANPIKAVGDHQVSVRLHPEVSATIRLEVIGN